MQIIQPDWLKHFKDRSGFATWQHSIKLCMCVAFMLEAKASELSLYWDESTRIQHRLYALVAVLLELANTAGSDVAFATSVIVLGCV